MNVQALELSSVQNRDWGEYDKLSQALTRRKVNQRTHGS